MSLEQTACEDLKAFERRLTEVIACLQPSTLRWRIVLVIISVCTAIGAWYWLTDPHTSDVSFTQSLMNHPFFFISSLLLVLLLLTGVLKRVIAPSIITTRARVVLSDFNMSCDETGKLILKPRPVLSPQTQYEEVPGTRQLPVASHSPISPRKAMRLQFRHEPQFNSNS